MMNNNSVSFANQPQVRQRTRTTTAVRHRTRALPSSPYGIRTQGNTRNIDGPSPTNPKFTLPISVTPGNARIDKVTLTNDIGSLRTLHGDDYAQFRYHLRNTDGAIFLCSPDQGEGKRPVQIRSSETARDGSRLTKPLFQGKLRTFYHESFIFLSTELYLNPSKAVRFYPQMSYATSGLFERPTPSSLPRTLDGTLNCLPAWISQSRYLDGERKYFENVLQQISQSCLQASQMVDVGEAVLSPCDFCLKGCEVYFEFHCPNAVETLRVITDHLRNYAAENTEREHAPRTEAIDTETVKNNESVKARLSKTEHLIVYAKTAKRLRFEIRFFKPSTNILPRRSSPNLDGLFQIIDTLRGRAADRVNSVLEFLNASAETPPITIASDWRFKRAWFAAAGWSASSDQLFETLRLKGRLIPHRFTPTEKSILRKVKRAGLVRYVRDRRAYVPISAD